MAKDFRLTIKNGDRFRRAFNQAPELTIEVLQDAFERAVGEVKGEAKLIVPVDTGRLRSSITGDINPKRGRVFTNVEYAPTVHRATFHPRIKSKDPLFLEHALRDKKKLVISIFGEALKKLTKEIASRT